MVAEMAQRARARVPSNVHAVGQWPQSQGGFFAVDVGGRWSHRARILGAFAAHVVRFDPMASRKVLGKHTRLTRAQVAERLGVCKTTVRELEGVELFPLVGERGVRYFDPQRVEELAARIKGEEFVGLDPDETQRAKALCIQMDTTLSAWVRDQIRKRLLAD